MNSNEVTAVTFAKLVHRIVGVIRRFVAQTFQPAVPQAFLPAIRSIDSPGSIRCARNQNRGRLESRRYGRLESLRYGFALALITIVCTESSGLAQLPAGWTDQDIGSPSHTGSASFANGTWTVAGGGSDIWNNADAFNYVSETGSDNAFIIAQVTSLQNTDPWAKAGLMFRNDSSPGSVFADVVASAGNGVTFQWRTSAGGSCGYSQVGGVVVPVLLKLVRSGTDFSAYYSSDGTAWTPIGPSQAITMSSTPMVGLAVTAHNDGALNTATFTSLTVSNVPPPPPPVFGVYRELWTNLSSAPGNSLSALTNTTYNPNWPDHPDASFTRVLTNLETEVNSGKNLYGQRLRAYVVPPRNGSYVFWISSDDASELFLSTDEAPSNRRSIARVNGWTNSREWTREANQQSVPIPLEGGRRYYLEALMQQGGGGDNLAVRWQLPDSSFEEPLPALSDAGTCMVPFDGIEKAPGIYQQSTDSTAVEGANATLSVLVTNHTAVSYQWTINGINIPGANVQKPSLTISNTTIAANDGQVYACVVSNAAGVVVSAPIRLTVIADTVQPTIARVFNQGSSNVLVVFSKPVELNSATATANYNFTNGLAVVSAGLSSDNLTVVLTTAPLVYGSNYWMAVNNVRDRATNPNTIAPNTLVRFQALPYSPQDIGQPPLASTVAMQGNGLDITASGSDIGGASDQFSLSSQIQTGDFDISVRLAGLSPSDVWAKAGLMARENLTTSSRFAAILATPAMNSTCFESRDPAAGQALLSGAFPANYPNTWLRLKRAANTFSGYASYDGQVWTLLGSVSIAMPAQIYFGLAVSSHNSTQSTTAEFRDIANTRITTQGTVANPHEPLGPSSRKTPLVISEIMYKPAPRADTNSLEFIELYNSNPWFHDISGYQIVADNLSYTVPAGTTVPGGAFLVIAASPASLQASYGVSGVLGPYVGSLKSSGTIQLLDEQGAVLLTIPYSNQAPWPPAADGTGHSLVLVNPTYGEADPRAWDISDVVGGSPGGMDAYRPSPLRNVVINEYLAHTDPPDYDYVELYNHSAQPVDISGCILTDDAATNKFIVPAGTILPPRGFIFFTELVLNFALNAAGEAIYFKNPDQSRVLDAVTFGGQENGVATGRWPDGGSQFYRLTAKTPGAANAAIRISDVVLNELMYNPITGDDDDQYIELYNQGSSRMDLDGWRLSDGVKYIFPSNTSLQPNGYLVIARNASHLRPKYPNLNATNCLGDFSGRLSHNGDRIVLTMPDTVVSTNKSGLVETNLIHIAVDELTYGTGGRWGQWAAGGGSSLELKDPRSNHRLAANWADSDETQKSVWANVEFTGVLDNGQNYDATIDYAQFGLLDTGECLLDNLEALSGSNGPNLVANPNFESGLANWSLQGCLSRSSLENSGYNNSGHSLHIRCSERLWTGANSAQMALNPNSLGQGQTATLRFKARWLRGSPEVLMRLNGNWLEATGNLPIPANLGSPGAANSCYQANSGPALYEITHSPAVPPANQPVLVTARVHDPDGLQSLTLNYRIDPVISYTTVTMKDDGTGGDALSGDGIFTGTIPAQNANTIVAFYVQATDSRGASSRFPALQNDNAAVHECVVMFGDSNPSGSFGVYHLWITQTNANRWNELSDLSNETHDCTIVNGTRVIYNASGRFAGSPYHQGFDYPYGNLCHYKWIFPDDDKFLGATSFNKIHQPGNGAGDDASLQREQTANTFLRALGVPWLNRRYVVVYVNGNRRGSLMEDTQTPDADVVKEHFPNDSDGWLYKMQPWFEFGPFPSGNSISFNNNSWVNLMPYTTTGGQKKVARYRYNFLVRRTPTSNSDFTNVFSLIDAASSYGKSNYVANMEALADMENWMRVFAANHAAGNWDSYGAQNAQNLYGYVGAKGTRYSLLMFDFNIVLGNSSSWGPGQSLFGTNGQDPNTGNIYNEPTFRRMYWRALQELVNGPLDVAQIGALLDAKYRAFVANGLTPEEPSNIKNWLTSARSSIAAQIASENTANFTVNPSVQTSNDVAWITGTAPVKVKTIEFNGIPYPVIWTSVTAWKATVPLVHGPNPFNVAGLDLHGNPVSGAIGQVSVAYNGTVPSPVGQIVINEIMYHPPVSGSEFVELYNSSSNVTFDLSGWLLNGLSYSFPPGSVLGPRSFLVLAADRLAFAAAYGGTVPVFDTFSGSLQNNGEMLTLVQPGTNGSADIVVAQVRYGDSAPWPSQADGNGSSLQLLDPRQDNWRAGNWSTSPHWVYFSTNGTASSSVLYIYLQSAGEVFVDDLKLVAGNVPEAGSNSLSDGDFESGFPGPWTVSANLVGSSLSTVVRRSGNASLHLVSTGAGSGQSSSIYQNLSPSLTQGQPYTLSFWYLQSTNGGPLTVRLSGSGVAATVNPGVGVNLTPATPAAANSTALTLPAFPSLWINEVQPDNLTGITNSAGQRTGWLELHNPTANAVSLTGCYLAKDYESLVAWAFPAGATVNPGEYKIIFADGQTNLSTLAELHTSFTLASGAGSVVLSRLNNTQPQVIDFINYTNLSANHSYGSFPDGQCFSRQNFFYATPRSPNNNSSAPLTVSINEWMAGNTNTLRNPVTGKYDDWFELYNYGTEVADLSGYYLTHSLTNQFEFRIPDGYKIAPKGFLLVWADKKNTNGTPDLHVNFKLSKTGTSIGLYGSDGKAVDYVTFGSQQSDISQGRYPDGTSSVINLSRPTPGSQNIGPHSPPVLASPGDKVVYPGQVLSFICQATDPNLPPPTLIYTLQPGAPANANLDPLTGVFVWRPTVDQAHSTNSITITVAESGAPEMSDTKTISIIVLAPNNAPVMRPIPDQQLLANSLLTFAVSATDSDQPAQTLTYALAPGAPTGAGLTPDGLFNWTPTSGQAPSTNWITITVTDSGTPPLSDSHSFQVVVSLPNTRPVLAQIADQVARPNSLLSFNVSATDLDQPPQALTFQLGPGAPAGTSLTSNGLFNWTPTDAQAPSTNLISIIVWDNGTPALSDNRSFVVVVSSANTRPLLHPIPDQKTYPNTRLSFTISATDTDQPPQTLTFALAPGAPSGATISTNGLFTWTPADNQAPSTNAVTVTVSDNGSPPLSDSQSFQVVVVRTNSRPVLTSIPDQKATSNTLLTFTAQAADADLPTQKLTFTLDPGAPAGANITPDGVFTWTPSAAQNATTNLITVTVTDDGVPPLSDSISFTVVVGVQLSLQSCSNSCGDFTDTSGVVLDSQTQTITAPIQPGTHFFRLRADIPTRIVLIQVIQDKVVVKYVVE